MGDIIKGDVTGFASGLSAVSDPAWVQILSYVNQYQLTSCESDVDRRLARIYLAAHLATMQLRSNTQGATGASGPLISEAAGDVRNAYGFISLTNRGALGLTTWGLLYLEILEASCCDLPMLI